MRRSEANDGWHNAAVPRVTRPQKRAPVTVRAAISVFGSELRVQLIHYFLTTPGSSQADACRALGVAQRSASDNTNALVDTGVLIEVPGRTQRAVRYEVDHARLTELKTALDRYLTPADREQ